MVSIFKNLFVHLRTWIKFLIILAIGLGIIFFVVLSAYKPMYAVTINGKFLGYTEDKSKLQDKISQYMKSGDDSANIAFVDIETLPEYSLCLIKRDHEANDSEIFSQIISTGITYYKYYAIMVDSEEKYYVSTYQECENVIQQLKEKDSANIDNISYIVKYEQTVRIRPTLKNQLLCLANSFFTATSYTRRRGSSISLTTSPIKCTTMTQTARIMTMASTTGISRLLMETMSRRPIPGREKICSITMQPASISATVAAKKATIGRREFFRAWLRKALCRL